ncbi:MAG TPA: hypothetical protein VFA11_01460 [Acidimicrobiales bacterium]|nr:hypothetical protein [Acidimicrobiales bacterium]
MKLVDERGQAAGIEMLVFGVLVLILGVLVIGDAWAVVDGKLAAIDAAREAARAFVQASSPATAAADARQAATASVVAEGRDPTRLSTAIEGTLTRCTRVRVDVTYRAHLVNVPFIGAFGREFSDHASHSQLVDPYRSGLPGAAGCP